jgi:hypothetical protein
MALSNIITEPRRELLETAMGVLFFAAVIGLDIPMAYIIRQCVNLWDAGFVGNGWSYFFGLWALAMGGGVLLLIHIIGEAICNRMAKYGWEIRPKQRYARDRRGNRYVI